jgi:hypothetical protein
MHWSIIIIVIIIITCINIILVGWLFLCFFIICFDIVIRIWKLSYLDTSNIALQQSTQLRVIGGPNYPSYRLVDGRIEQPSCVAFDPFPDNNNLEFRLSFHQPKSIPYLRIHLIYQGTSNVYNIYRLMLKL